MDDYSFIWLFLAGFNTASLLLISLNLASIHWRLRDLVNLLKERRP